MSYWGSEMNRRDFLRKAWIAGAGMAVLSRLPKGPDNAMDFLLDEMSKGARREAPVLMKNIGISWNSAAMDSVSLSWTETEAGRAERFAQQARSICDAIKPAIDALAELEEFEAPKIGRAWYVGPGGDDANDGLTPETCLLSFEEGMKRAGREDEVNAIADFVL